MGVQTQHNLEEWHARMEEFEKEHPRSEAFFRFVLRCSIFFVVVMFGWYGAEAARYFSSLVGFAPVFLIFLAVYAVERIVELICFQRRRVRGRIFDRWSLYLLAASHVVVVGITAAECLRPGRHLVLPAAVAGYVSLIGSTFLRWWTIAALGPHESAHIEIREPHPVISTGPYRYLRHPRYFANVIEVVCIPLMGNAWYALLLALLSYLPLTWLRLVREEAVMGEKLGPTYEDYRAEVKLWPSWGRRG